MPLIPLFPAVALVMGRGQSGGRAGRGGPAAGGCNRTAKRPREASVRAMALAPPTLRRTWGYLPERRRSTYAWHRTGPAAGALDKSRDPQPLVLGVEVPAADWKDPDVPSRFGEPKLGRERLKSGGSLGHWATVRTPASRQGNADRASWIDNLPLWQRTADDATRSTRAP